jgi:hypothetical protein
MNPLVTENIALSTAYLKVAIEMRMIVFIIIKLGACKNKNAKRLFHFKTINDLA